ncbi:hypothetical protein NLO72_02375 [Pseudomonas tremae]|uniref:hypothetical protein n=1 Tax=Pseudomonas tremae TaxID=200454 RepID=UPI002109F5E2|nr:hypothetical protein [Pseudomonas tremae]MCQ2988080.1 hypothetical protein [Pseudomonas tremae]
MNIKTAEYIKKGCRPRSTLIKTIATVTVLSTLLGCQPRMTTPTVPLDVPHSASSAAALELWQRDKNAPGGWKMTCSIPWVEQFFQMGTDYGCQNDAATAYRLSNVYPIDGTATVIAFYDDRCNDSNRFDDDYYKYKLTKSIENFWPNSLAPDLPLGEVTDGLEYFEGRYYNGIDGKLSCVDIYKESAE